MRFEKWQALGNDYVIVEQSELPWELTEVRIRALCALHTGVGSDGVLLLSEAEDPAHVARLRIFNPDGSESGLSGNGAREAVLYLRAAGWVEADRFAIVTAAGELRPTITGPGEVSMELGSAALTSADFPSGGSDGRGRVESAGRHWDFQFVDVGNPQCVIEVESGLEELDLPTIGPAIERSELFPNRTNVSFVGFDGPRVRARIFERGVGETLSSGTGASGAAVAARLAGAEGPLSVSLDGGELEVGVGPALELTLTGSAERVYSAVLSDELRARLAAL